MRRKFNYTIFCLVALLCGVSMVACNEDPIEQNNYSAESGGTTGDSLIKEFVVEYGSYQYSLPIDSETLSMTLDQVYYSELVSSVSVTLAEGVTIYPEPADVDQWGTTQTFTVTNDGKDTEYTLNFPNYREIFYFKSVGYITAAYFDYENKINTIDWSNLTHVIMSFIQAKSDGTIQDSTATLTDRLNHLKTIKDENEFKLMIAIQSSSTSTLEFYNAIRYDNTRAALVDAIVDYVELHDLDGIDVDFEEYSYTNTTAFSSFMSELRVDIDALAEKLGREVLLTAAVATGNYPSSMGADVDFLNLMIYDIGWSSLNAQHASYSSFTSMMSSYASKFGVTIDKLIGGLPFYGYTYDGLGGDSPAAASKAMQKAYYEIYTTYLGKTSSDGTTLYDADYIADNNQVENTVYNGRDLLRQKCEYVLNNNYGGVMIWQIGQDLTDSDEDQSTHKLLPVIGETFPFLEGKTLSVE